MAIIKEIGNNKGWQEHVGKGTLCTIGENVNWCSHNGKEDIVSSKIKKLNYHIIQQFNFWEFIWRKWKHKLQKIHIYLYTRICTYIYVCVCINTYIYIYMDFPGGSVGKESACNAGSTLGLGISSGEGNKAWKIPWTEETGGTVHGISRVRHDLMTSPPSSPHTHTHTHIYIIHTHIHIAVYCGLPWCSVVMNLPANARCRFNPWVRNVPLEKEMATH